MKLCPHCKKAKLEIVKGVEPFSLDHFLCPNCFSTFNIILKGSEKGINEIDLG